MPTFFGLLGASIYVLGCVVCLKAYWQEHQDMEFRANVGLGLIALGLFFIVVAMGD